MTDNDLMIHCVYPNEQALFLGFMPYVKDGGLFVHTKNTHELGQSVTLSITFLDEIEPHIVQGKVVWITPKGAQGNKPAGIGVQFVSDNKRQMVNLIETYLAGKLKSTQPTDTM